MQTIYIYIFIVIINRSLRGGYLPVPPGCRTAPQFYERYSVVLQVVTRRPGGRSWAPRWVCVCSRPGGSGDSWDLPWARHGIRIPACEPEFGPLFSLGLTRSNWALVKGCQFMSFMRPQPWIGGLVTPRCMQSGAVSSGNWPDSSALRKGRRNCSRPASRSVRPRARAGEAVVPGPHRVRVHLSRHPGPGFPHPGLLRGRCTGTK